jgi:hypothetical protein
LRVYLYGVCQAVDLTEPLHRRGVRVLRLRLLLLAVVCEEGRVSRESNSDFASELGVFF